MPALVEEGFKTGAPANPGGGFDSPSASARCGFSAPFGCMRVDFPSASSH